MSHPVKVFLGSCFEPYKLDGQGQPDPQGKSNREIGEWFRQEILRLGNGRIDVAVILDPMDDSISETVKHEIAAADAAVFVFPKRVQCQITKAWTTSQYVISESGFAAARFRHRAHGR